MVALQGRNVVPANMIDDLFRLRAITDMIPQADDIIHAGSCDISPNLLECFHVTMDIGNNGYFHP